MFGWFALLLFLLATASFWLRLVYIVKKGNGNRSSQVLVYSLWAAATLVTALFITERVPVEHGYDLSFYNALLINIFFISLIALASSLLSRSGFLGLIVLPLGVFCVALNLFLFQPNPSSSSYYSIGIEIHVLLSIMAFSLLGLSAVQAVLLFIQERQLKRHESPQLFAALPSLHENEISLHHFNVSGFILLTLALFTGFVYLDNIFAQHLVHKTVLSLLAWAVFATLLWGRHQFGWRGITAVRWTIAGFLVLLLAYLGSKLVLEMILNRP